MEFKILNSVPSLRACSRISCSIDSPIFFWRSWNANVVTANKKLLKPYNYLPFCVFQPLFLQLSLEV